jgi:hypothetical protein
MVTEQMWNGFARQSLAQFVLNCPSVCQRLHGQRQADQEANGHLGHYELDVA